MVGWPWLAARWLRSCKEIVGYLRVVPKVLRASLLLAEVRLMIASKSLAGTMFVLTLLIAMPAQAVILVSSDEIWDGHKTPAQQMA